MIASRLFKALVTRLDCDKFEIARGDLKALVNGNTRYPDLIVFPSPRDLDGDAAPDPVVVAEIVSPATRLVDRFDKNVDYAETPCILHYLMVSATQRAAVVCSRDARGWASVELEGTGSVALPAIGVEVSLDDIYRGVTFRTDPG